MKIDVSGLFSGVQERIPIAALLPFPEEVRCGIPLFEAPVAVNGEIVNHCGVVELSYQVNFQMHTACDRCLTDVRRQVQKRFSHTLVNSLNREQEQEYIVVSDGRLDLAQLVRSDILLDLPSVVLCDDDCKGLCSLCGADLNHQSCHCASSAKNGPFDVLRQLLEQENLP